MGDSQHTQNIQINKVIGESERCVFYFIEKNRMAFWPTQYEDTHTNNYRIRWFAISSLKIVF